MGHLCSADRGLNMSIPLRAHRHLCSHLVARNKGRGGGLTLGRSRLLIPFVPMASRYFIKGRVGASGSKCCPCCHEHSIDWGQNIFLVLSLIPSLLFFLKKYVSGANPHMKIMITLVQWNLLINLFLIGLTTMEQEVNYYEHNIHIHLVSLLGLIFPSPHKWIWEYPLLSEV